MRHRWSKTRGRDAGDEEKVKKGSKATAKNPRKSLSKRAHNGVCGGVPVPDKTVQVQKDQVAIPHDAPSIISREISPGFSDTSEMDYEYLEAIHMVGGYARSKEKVETYLAETEKKTARPISHPLSPYEYNDGRTEKGFVDIDKPGRERMAQNLETNGHEKHFKGNPQPYVKCSKRTKSILKRRQHNRRLQPIYETIKPHDSDSEPELMDLRDQRDLDWPDVISPTISRTTSTASSQSSVSSCPSPSSRLAYKLGFDDCTIEPSSLPGNVVKVGRIEVAENGGPLSVGNYKASSNPHGSTTRKRTRHV